MSFTLLEIAVSLVLLYVAISIGLILTPRIMLLIRKVWRRVEDPEGDSVIIEVLKSRPHNKDRPDDE